VAQQCKENIYAIQTLKDFQYFEESKDYGMSVREKSKSMVALLNDEDRLKTERAKALKAKERFHQSMGMGSDSDVSTTFCCLCCSRESVALSNWLDVESSLFRFSCYLFWGSGL
jgi:hypothetical protein